MGYLGYIRESEGKWIIKWKKIVSCGFGGFASLDYYYALEPRP